MHAVKTSQLCVLVAGLIALSACNAQEASKAESTGGVLATVNGVAVPKARLDLLMKDRAQQGQPDTPDAHEALRQKLIDSEIMAQEAMKRGLDKESEVQTKIEMARQVVLIQALFQNIVKSNPVSEDGLKAEYEKIKEQMGSKEYLARHVLVDTKAEADDIVAQLKKGAKFDKLAKQKSKDPGSKNEGGKLDWSIPNAYVPPFAQALTKLKKGEYTQEPVQSQFGWHVIKLEDERSLQPPPFDMVKAELQQRMQQQKIEQTVEELRSKSKIE